MKSLVLFIIRFYQRFLSPLKGFCCAYRTHTGRASCSQLGYRAIRRFGVFGGVSVLRERTYLCGVAQRRYAPLYVRPPRAQRGDCDLSCDLPDLNCDLPTGDCGSSDNSKSKRKRPDEQTVHLPPDPRARTLARAADSSHG